MPPVLFLVLAASAIAICDGATPRKLAPYCPYCDSSVYGYCTDKLLHDACCCLDPYENELPLECKLADCSFLHANSCRDHNLITRCCCNKFV
ncbi:Hypothetical protein NTJ_03377 [Nesidiocoris tenuis]|uniref:CCC domain-containing protein n=1 Tax=Nesidiocoris tenuis TaxID=355587 RepID=A0ABN7AH86_9HEMI|nr:Hypothetical protein NTJ_03377 [Nesidiocoris tenuis]